jgi:hypothetical protein
VLCVSTIKGPVTDGEMPRASNRWPLNVVEKRESVLSTLRTVVACAVRSPRTCTRAAFPSASRASKSSGTFTQIFALASNVSPAAVSCSVSNAD